MLYKSGDILETVQDREQCYYSPVRRSDRSRNLE